MNMYIKSMNSKGYLLAITKGYLIVIDDYSGPLEVGDKVDIITNGALVGKAEYVKNSKRYWLNLAGDVESEEVFKKM